MGNASTMKQVGGCDFLVSICFFWAGFNEEENIYTMMMSCPLSSLRVGNASTMKQVGGCDVLASSCNLF